MDDSIRLGLKERGSAVQQRGFGTGLAAILAFFAFLSWRGSGRAAPWYALASLASGMLAALRPAAFGPVYRPWMKVAGVLAQANTAIVTACLYFLVFTPYALILRLAGRDPLAREGDGGGWIARAPVADYKSYERQF